MIWLTGLPTLTTMTTVLHNAIPYSHNMVRFKGDPFHIGTLHCSSCLPIQIHPALWSRDTFFPSTSKYDDTDSASCCKERPKGLLAPGINEALSSMELCKTDWCHTWDLIHNNYSTWSHSSGANLKKDRLRVWDHWRICYTMFSYEQSVEKTYCESTYVYRFDEDEIPMTFERNEDQWTKCLKETT